MKRLFKSHGTGEFERSQLGKIGENVIFEPGVLIFHPENIEIGSNVYVGHNSILKAYYKNLMQIGNNVWIGQNCFFHSGGGITISDNVGIGPGVKILTSKHSEQGRDIPILFSDIEFGPVTIGEDSDIGIGSIILPNVNIGKGVQVGAGSIVTKDLPDYSVAYGVPAKIVRER